MKTSTSRSLMITTAVIALGLASPAIAQQQGGQTGGAGMASQSASQSQSNLKQHIATLEQGRKQIQDAQPAQVQQLKQPLVQALGDIEKDLQGMQGQQTQSASKSIDEAQQALESQQADKGRIVQALDNVLKDVRQLQTASTSGSGVGSGAQIAVQQPSPQVTVQQPAPQVSVNQPPPQVTVQQPKPQITVEQPKPKVTVDQGEPKVTVQKQGEPKVNVEQQRQAQVDVQSPANRPSESTTGTRTGVGSGAGSSAQPSGTTAGRMESGATGAGTSLVDANRDQLVGKEIYGANNENIGEVEDVVIGQNAKLESVLVDVGGFLGIGARRVAIPISQLRLQGDRILSDLTEEQARALPEHKGNQ